MKPKYFQVLLSSLVFYFFFTELRDAAYFGLPKVLESYSTFPRLLLSFSAPSVFSLYALGAYACLLWTFRKSPAISVCCILINIPLIMALRYSIEDVLFPATLGFDNYRDDISAKDYFFDNLYYAVVFTAVGVVFYFFQTSRYKERQQQELIVQNQKTELAFLRSQINPHFLFNTLNNTYTLVYQKSDKALMAMDKLSNLLRYALYEQADQVRLEKELTYIEDFITLQSLRYDYPVQIRLEKAEGVEQVLVPPFLFISFVENAFKHGDLKDPQQPLLIHFLTENGQLHFSIRNQISQMQKDQQGGIGLDNVRKRLNLIYGNQHTLQIEASSVRFDVNLIIPAVYPATKS